MNWWLSEGKESRGARHKARSALAAAEIALAIVVLVASGLLLRSFVTLTAVRPGFETRHVLAADISLPQFEYSKPAQWIAFSDSLLGKIQAEPGLQNTAAAVPLPLGEGFVNLGFEIEGAAPLPTGKAQSADYVSVTPGYFGVMGIPLLRGRGFTQEDNLSAPKVALISETLARVYFANQNPIGKRMIFGFPPNGTAAREIVGVVGDVRDVALNQEPGAMMYVPFDQAPFWGEQIVTKTTLSSASVTATIRKDVASVDKDLPVSEVSSMEHMVEATVAQPKFRTVLFGSFGLIALVLSGAGIFGVISYLVSNRTHEIGIRIALGASRASVLELILAQSAKLLLFGVAVGVPVAFVWARLLGNLLYTVGPADPLTFVGVTVLLAIVAVAASYVPARRAMKVDPVIALRYE